MVNKPFFGSSVYPKAHPFFPAMEAGLMKNITSAQKLSLCCEKRDHLSYNYTTTETDSWFS